MQLVDERRSWRGIISNSKSMRDVFEQIDRVARVDATVLIRGESGTGKELVAEAIHRGSERAEGPFMAVNVAAVPETLIESELFGHVDGAFTGAEKRRAGRFEAARGGTLFIDEIGDLKLTSQAKLLRVLENRQISPVGSNEVHDVDVRVLFATNRDLETMVAQAEFREDIYYRINVVAIHLPPLRQRPDDIGLLVEHMLDELCAINGKDRVELDEELQRFLKTHCWPGNVRQLRNCLESMVVLASSGVLTVDDLPATIQKRARDPQSDFQLPLDISLDEIERATVLDRLQRYGGNRTQAADSLGVSVRTLQRRLKSWEQRGFGPSEVPR